MTRAGPTLRVAWGVVLGVLWFATPARAEGLLRLSLQGAEIKESQILPHKHARSFAPLSDLSCLSLPGLKHLAAACGTPSTAGGIAPVDPVLQLELPGRSIRTYPIPTTLSPRWDYDVILDRAVFDQDGIARFQVRDFHGPQLAPLLCEVPVLLRTLRKPGPQKIEDDGCSISVLVTELPPTSPRTYQFFIPANRQMADLARNARGGGQGYTPIPVAEGEIVEVRAKGVVKPSRLRHPERVSGPLGIPTIQTKIQFNQPGFRGCPECNHAALIGFVGARGLVIGQEKRFPVEHAGLLILAINDVRVDDNEGGYEVQVKVALPASGEASFRGKVTVQEAIAGRVVEQIIDAHEGDVESCMKGMRPLGEAEMEFTIDPAGVPLRVVLRGGKESDGRVGERKKVFQCIEKEARRWRFPPPRTQVTVKAPLSLDPS